jgi:DNA gyrase subunit A
MTIRMAIDKLRVMGRATQGVRLINLKGADSIAGLAKSPKEEDEEEDVTEFIEGETPVVIGGSEENNTVEEAPTAENDAETTDTDE